MNIPKDRQIIIETTYGKRVAMWNEQGNQFVYADPAADMYKGKWNMSYYENEYIDEKDIIGWSDL